VWLQQPARDCQAAPAAPARLAHTQAPASARCPAGTGATNRPPLSAPLQQPHYCFPGGITLAPLRDLPQATLALGAAAGQRVGLSANINMPRDLPQATLALDAAAGQRVSLGAKFTCTATCRRPRWRWDAAAGQRVGLSAKVGDGPAVLLCSLREGGQESCNLDIVLDSYSEFSVTGGAAVHLAGYYMPEYEGARRGGPPLAAGGRMADP